MKFGISTAIPPGDGPFEDWIAYVKAAEETGFELLGMGDGMTRTFECTVQMALLAIYSKLNFGSTVTNPVTRHPGVTANAFASVQKISGGRAFLGLGTGNSAVRNLGMVPATLAHLREYVQCVRDLIRTGEGRYAGQLCSLPWAPKAVPEGLPIYIAADGPRALELAGEIGDGVIVGGGFSDGYLEHVYNALERGAKKAVRRVEDLDIWFMAELITDEDPNRAHELSLTSLSALCSRTFRTFEGKAAPAEIRSQLDEFNARYDYSGHVTGENASLVDELDLRDFLADRFLISGPNDAVIERLKALERKGVPNIFLMGFGQDVNDLFRDLKTVIPAVR